MTRDYTIIVPTLPTSKEEEAALLAACLELEKAPSVTVLTQLPSGLAIHPRPTRPS